MAPSVEGISHDEARRVLQRAGYPADLNGPPGVVGRTETTAHDGAGPSGPA